MNKVFCDLCGKEIIGKECAIRIYEVDLPGKNYLNLDACEDCAKASTQVIGLYLKNDIQKGNR